MEDFFLFYPLSNPTTEATVVTLTGIYFIHHILLFFELYNFRLIKD